MENHLEHKIAEAYKRKDENFSFGGKEKLWNQISGELGHSKGVAPFWRVAAIILALIAFSGVFAAITVFQKSTKNMNDFGVQNSELRQELDSLINLKPEIITEKVIIEKEKIVYRNAEILKKESLSKNVSSEALENEILKLKSQLKLQEQNFKIIKDSLILAQNELAKLESNFETNEEKVIPGFKLKTERMQDQIQPVKTDAAPKMKVQILKFQDNMIYETGSTLLKK